MVSCNLPANACDFSGAAELCQSVQCTKAIIGLRYFLRGLGFAPTGPTSIYTDARVLIDGTRCKRISTELKWVAPKYAMIHFAEKCKAIFLIKYPTADNFADITTKPLTGAPFFRHRLSILGHTELSPHIKQLHLTPPPS
jgi:hypothetical protein